MTADEGGIKTIADAVAVGIAAAGKARVESHPVIGRGFGAYGGPNAPAGPMGARAPFVYGPAAMAALRFIEQERLCPGAIALGRFDAVEFLAQCQATLDAARGSSGGGNTT